MKKFLAFLLLVSLVVIILVSVAGYYLSRPDVPNPTTVVMATHTPATDDPVVTPDATDPPAEEPDGDAPTPENDPTGAPPVSQDDTEATLRVLEQTDLPARDLYALAILFGNIPADTPRVPNESDPGYEVGDERTFTVSNIATQENFEADATLRAQTDHANWWVQDDVRVDQEDLEESAQVFEEQTYPTNREIFGSEWSPGIDGDVRVNVFLGDVAGVGGYFSSADEYPRSVNPNSNEMEIFYLNIYNAGPGNSYFDGVLAHEFQHMIHWNTDRNEELWVNEGLAELAAHLNDFDVGSSMQSYLRNPDIPVTRWEEQTSDFYASAYGFMRYLYERFGAETIGDLVREEENGGHGVAEVTGLTFDEVFADWTVANLIDDASIADGQYEAPLSGTPGFADTVRDYPYSERETVNQYGTDYFEFTASSGDGALTLLFEGDSTVPLLPTSAHSGSWMLWSNRGDDSYSTVYRAFDLSDVDEATLNFWAWHEIEEDYDYAYVAVSTDGGALWQVLETEDTTTTNPNGNSLGAAFTGHSGRRGGEWTEQSADLTPYAGQEILVGFHYVTDDALNEEGFLVDDVSIPEIEYEEDFEEGSEGWTFAGWARVDNVLPQRFILRAVLDGADGYEVLPIELDDNNRALFNVEEFGGDVDRVILIVTAATQETTREAEYRLRVSSE